MFKKLLTAAAVGAMMFASSTVTAQEKVCVGYDRLMSMWTEVEKEFPLVDIVGGSLKGDDLKAYLAVIETIFVKLPIPGEYDEIIFSMNRNDMRADPTILAVFNKGCFIQWIGIPNEVHRKAVAEVGISVDMIDNNQTTNEMVKPEVDA